MRCLNRRAVHIVARTCVRIGRRIVVGPAAVGIYIGTAGSCSGWIVVRICVGLCSRSV